MIVKFERTQFGWRAYVKQGRAWVYFGHFYTQREARLARAIDGRA